MPAGRPALGKTVPEQPEVLIGLERFGFGPYSRRIAQFFPILTDQLFRAVCENMDRWRALN